MCSKRAQNVHFRWSDLGPRLALEAERRPPTFLRWPHGRHACACGRQLGAALRPRSSACEPDKRYDRYDFSSYRGAEEAYRVRDVRPPPPSDEEAARQAAARASAARQAPNQTRAAVRLGLQLLE